MDDRSINPATGKPYIQFGPNGPIDPSSWKDEQERNNDLRNYPAADVFPSYKVAMRTYRSFDKDKFKIVRGGVSKYKIVPRSDPSPELFGE